MEEYLALAWIWFLHAAIAGLLTMPIVLFSAQRVRWQWWELSAFFVPFGLWTTFLFSELSVGKSLANLGEPLYFSFAIPAAALIRVAAGPGPAERVLAVTLLLAVCGMAVAVFFLVPPLSE
jgi:hypothetical protein